MKIRILIVASVLFSTSAFAGGYRVALQGQKALGMGHTGVAMTDSAEVVFFNPAGMVFLRADSDISAGVTLIDAVTKFQNRESNAIAETNNSIGTPINFYYSKKYDGTTSYGLGIYTPYGNAVEWEKDWPGSNLVNNIKLRTFYIQPTVSYKVSDKLSFGFGPTYVIGSVKFNRNLRSSPSIGDENGNRANVTIEAAGIHSLGFNVGFLAKPSKVFSVGVNYRSKVDLKARGEDAKFENIPTSMQAGLPNTTFDADLVLPAELTLGIAYNVTSSTVLAFDFNRTFWSAYENLDVQFNSNAGLSANPRNYNDANTYRVGIQQKIGGKLTLRGGAYYDKTPISDGYYTPETARNDSLGFTAGGSFAISKGLEIDFSFLYLMFDEFNGSYNFVDDGGDTLTSFGGEYKTSAIIGGFGFNYKY